jgi:hypothetical protein
VLIGGSYTTIRDELGNEINRVKNSELLKKADIASPVKDSGPKSNP